MDFSRATILCLGDVMLDRLAYCDTERISPEAPVPVLLLQRTRSMLGGAGNVARNIAALGGTAVLVGLIGQDAAGAEPAGGLRILGQRHRDEDQSVVHQYAEQHQPERNARAQQSRPTAWPPGVGAGAPGST